jgi:hypothetical protein
LFGAVNCYNLLLTTEPIKQARYTGQLVLLVELFFSDTWSTFWFSAIPDLGKMHDIFNCLLFEVSNHFRLSADSFSSKSVKLECKVFPNDHDLTLN